MKYKKCPRCEINYIREEEELCKICREEVQGKREKDVFDKELCPYCYKNYIDFNQIMCAKCQEKRAKKIAADIAKEEDL